eukprot:3802436-Rhodomonas_salina.2
MKGRKVAARWERRAGQGSRSVGGAWVARLRGSVGGGKLGRDGRRLSEGRVVGKVEMRRERRTGQPAGPKGLGARHALHTAAQRREQQLRSAESSSCAAPRAAAAAVPTDAPAAALTEVPRATAAKLRAAEHPVIPIQCSPATP